MPACYDERRVEGAAKTQIGAVFDHIGAALTAPSPSMGRDEGDHERNVLKTNPYPALRAAFSRKREKGLRPQSRRSDD